MERFYSTYDDLASGDPVWCAMVNLVLAIGCRATFGSSEDQTCGLFENALSQFSWIVLGHSHLRKVQTLALMV